MLENKSGKKEPTKKAKKVREEYVAEDDVKVAKILVSLIFFL